MTKLTPFKLQACLAVCLLIIGFSIQSSFAKVLNCSVANYYYLTYEQPIFHKLGQRVITGPNKQKDVFQFKFHNLDSDRPIYEGEDTKVTLLKIDAGDRIYLLGQHPTSNNLFTFTIFPKEMILTWQKSLINAFGEPRALTSMGKCR